MIIKKKEDIQIKSWADIRGLVNHHSDASWKVQLSKIDEIHRTKNWGTVKKPYYIPKSSLGFHVGYNFLIEKDGTIIQTRKIGELIVAQKNNNKNFLAVCLAGAFEKEKPTKAQIESLTRLYAYIMAYKPMPCYYRHGDMKFSKTSCPVLPSDFYKELQLKASGIVIKGLQEKVKQVKIKK